MYDPGHFEIFEFEKEMLVYPKSEALLKPHRAELRTTTEKEDVHEIFHRARFVKYCSVGDLYVRRLARFHFCDSIFVVRSKQFSSIRGVTYKK